MGINQNVLLCFQGHTTRNQHAKFRTILTSGLGDMSDLLSSLLVPTITYVETCTCLIRLFGPGRCHPMLKDREFACIECDVTTGGLFTMDLVVGPDSVIITRSKLMKSAAELN